MPASMPSICKPRQFDEVVSEVKLAFRLNQALFDELAGNLAAYRGHDKVFG